MLCTCLSVCPHICLYVLTQKVNSNAGNEDTPEQMCRNDVKYSPNQYLICSIVAKWQFPLWYDLIINSSTCLAEQIKVVYVSWLIQSASNVSHLQRRSLSLFPAALLLILKSCHFYLGFFSQSYHPLIIVFMFPAWNEQWSLGNCNDFTQICSCVDSIETCSSSLLACWCLQGFWSTKLLNVVIVCVSTQNGSDVALYSDS